MPSAFRCTGLTKSYSDFTLGPLDLELESGVVLGYLGPNGAGKTTTMNCLTGLVRPDAGQVEISTRAVNPADPLWKRDVALVSDRQPFYEKWSAARNLSFLSGFYPAWSTDTVAELARRFDVPLDHRVRDLSRGNRVKLSIVAALAASTPLLLLDEPTAGLDPVVRDDVLGVLFDLLERGDRALFYSTHILSDIGRLADELAFVADGQVVLRATVADLEEEWRSVTFRLPDGVVELPGPLRGIVRSERSGHDGRVISCDGTATAARLGELGAQQIRPTPMGIDDIAVEIMKGGHRVVTGQS